MSNSSIKINEILLSMVSCESLQNIQKYYTTNNKLIDVNYQNNRIINDSVLYERLDIIAWLSTFIKIFELDNYENYIEQCVFMNNIDLLRWFYNYNSAYFLNLTNSEEKSSKYVKYVKQCISMDSISLLQWFYNLDSRFFMDLIDKSDDLFLLMCKNDAIKCVNFIKTLNKEYNVEVKDNKIIDKWKNNDVLFYIFHETAEEKSNYSNVTYTSSEEWNLRQILKIDNEQYLLEKLSSVKDDDFEPSSCGIFEKTTVDLSKRNSLHCKYQINAKINNFAQLITKLSEFDEFPLKNSKCVPDDLFDFIKYNPGGKFDMHFDSKKSTYHSHTLLLFPPQKIDGGELVVKYGFDSSWSDKRVNKIIKPHEHLWTVVLFPIGVLHASNPVLNGEKITLKGTACIDKAERIKIINKQINYNIPGLYGLADGSFRHYINNTFYDKTKTEEKNDFEEIVNVSFDNNDDEW